MATHYLTEFLEARGTLEYAALLQNINLVKSNWELNNEMCFFKRERWNQTQNKFEICNTNESWRKRLTFDGDLPEHEVSLLRNTTSNDQAHDE